MTANGWLQILFYSAVVLAITKPAGVYILRVYDGSLRWLAPLERAIYRISGVDPDEDQHWTRYAAGLLLFSAVSMLVTYVALRLQDSLPLNPFARAAVPDRQAFETAASFTTNTNWQSYSGETMMSYFSQMTQLAFHNFTSAACGVAAAVALARGIARRSAGKIGNFWVDLVRGTLYLFLPLSFLFALLFVQQGAIQNFAHYVTATTLEGAKQVLAMGPVASQVGDQAAGDERRRLLQRQRRASVREPDALDELPVDVRDLRHPRRAYLHLRAHGEEPAPRVGAVGGDVRAVLRRRDDGLLGRGARQPDPRGARHRPRRIRRQSRRQHGRERGPFRDRQLGPVRHGDHRRVLRRRQQHARLVHAHRRDGAARQHPARRADFRRGGVGPVRDDRDGRTHGVHRRAHGGPNARVPREEDPEPRSAHGDAVRADLPGGDPAVHRGVVGTADGARGAEQRGAARPVGDPVRVHARSPATTAARSPGSPAGPTTTTRCSVSARCSGASR